MSGKRRAVIGLLAILVGACIACSDDKGTHPSVANPSLPSTGLSATAASVTPSPAAARSAPTPLTAPAVASGELTRVVFSRDGGIPSRGSTISRTARSGVEYEVRGACTSSSPNHVVAYDILIAKVDSTERPMVSGEIPCDGGEKVDGLPTPPSSMPLTIRITGLSGVTHAYAIVAPQS